MLGIEDSVVSETAKSLSSWSLFSSGEMYSNKIFTEICNHKLLSDVEEPMGVLIIHAWSGLQIRKAFLFEVK